MRRSLASTERCVYLCNFSDAANVHQMPHDDGEPLQSSILMSFFSHLLPCVEIDRLRFILFLVLYDTRALVAVGCFFLSSMVCSFLAHIGEAVTRIVFGAHIIWQAQSTIHICEKRCSYSHIYTI